jgi:hypothetical protein
MVNVMKFDKHLKLIAIHKETAEEYEVCMICFPLGRPSGKDVAVTSKDDNDLTEWMSIDEVIIVNAAER